MQEKWGLTEKGFHRPTYTELLNACEYKARELFGDKVVLTIRSPLGLLLRILAWMMNLILGELEAVYNSAFVDTASGNALYNLGKGIGLQLISKAKATGYVTISGDPETKIPSGYLVGTNGGLQYVTMAEAVIPATGKLSALVQAVESGPLYNTEAGTVVVIVNPSAVPGIRSVTNPKKITGGRERETDEEYRQRYYKSIDSPGGVNADAIRAALLNNVTGVMSALVYANEMDTEDEIYQLPPHSIEAVVYGGLDEDVAQELYRKKAGGIQTAGNKEVTVLTASFQNMTVRFSRPKEKKIYILIKGLKKTEEYPGDEEIKRKLIEYIGGTADSGLGIGTDVIRMKVAGILSQTAGIEDFQLLLCEDGSSYAEKNIEIGIREKAVTEESAVSFK